MATNNDDASAEAPEQRGAEAGGSSSSKGGTPRLGAIIALALVAAIVVWAIVASSGCGGGGDGNTPPQDTQAQGTPPVLLSASGLAELVRGTGQPIYWVGPRPDTMYEVQQTADGKAYVRYLPEGAEAGDDGSYLTVGTYPMADAFAATDAAAASPGSVRIPVEGVTAFYSESGANSAYIAFPDSPHQIEVWDPEPGTARQLVAGGKVKAVSPSQGKPARAVTEEQLGTFAAGLGHPVYWAGPEDGMAYELTQTADGLVYVRYLPEGANVGGAGPFRTVATYPVVDAFEKTKAVAEQSGMEMIELDDGGVAAVPTGSSDAGVYVAYPDADVQIEVFDPESGAARDLVESGQIVPVG